MGIPVIDFSKIEGKERLTLCLRLIVVVKSGVLSVKRRVTRNIENVDWEDVFLLSDENDNEWPSKTLGFKETMKEYRAELKEIGTQSHGNNDENLGLPKGYIKNAFDGGIDNAAFFGTKVSHYPPCPYPEKVNALRPHTDAGGVVFLFQDDEIEELSNGKYKSIWHRVVPQTDGQRRSIASFYNPSLKATIQPAVEKKVDDATNKTQQSQNSFGDDDIFGGPVPSSNQYGGVDLESVFSSSINRNSSGNLNSGNSGGFDAFDDLLGSKSKQKDPVDDLFGNFGVSSSGKHEKKGAGLDDFIPGFGGVSPSKTEAYSQIKIPPAPKGHTSNSSSPVVDDPFLVFESSVSQSDASWPFAGPSDQNTGKGSVQSSFDDFDDFIMGGPSDQNTGKGSVQSSFDDFDDFIMGGARSGSKVGVRTEAKKPSPGTAGFENNDYIDAIFGGSNGVRPNNAARPSSMSQDSLFDGVFHEERGPDMKQTSSRSAFSTKKASSATNVGNDFSSLFGDVATSSGEFHEIEGEPEERRRARLNRHMRMNARMREAVAEKNQRDHQSQLEQEEKRRIAETLDNDIKRWAAGKDGNLRALLSSLQQVLWPECGWRPVSLTDMITSESVKKVYKKANLCVHPDKVQQKGATLQQKKPGTSLVQRNFDEVLMILQLAKNVIETRS
ncbi:UNVERIFIED_CONTAM: Auxilin-related protein 2 [Sesamum latifolium]|uniref:Auxilin-related protein 2 n=1 Tax=Sesamum latifolium TaxID=2727402 RepID=A0AAW2VTQ4_9LAMI